MSEANTPVLETAAPATNLVDGGAAPAPAAAVEQQQSSVPGQGEAAAAAGQGAGTESAPAGASAEVQTPKGEDGADAPGAPETYADFSLPEGIELAGDMLTNLTSLAKAHNLNQGQAQALVDLGVQQATAIAERFTAQVKADPVPLPAHWAGEWSKQTSADPEIGGDKLATTMALTTRVFSTFATPAFGEFLNKTGLSHHPELIRFMHAVGKAVSEDTLVAPSGGSNRVPVGRDPARKLYPNMK